VSSYTVTDIDRLEREIREKLPRAKFDRWRDFGFALEVSIGARHVIACQPRTTYQDQIFRTADETVALLCLN
jgi:hypothetical protein